MAELETLVTSVIKKEMKNFVNIMPMEESNFQDEGKREEL